MSDRSYFTPSQRHDYFIRQLAGDLAPEADLARRAAAETIRAVSYNIAAHQYEADIEQVFHNGIAVLQHSLIKAWEGDITNYEKLALSDFGKDSRDFAMLMTRGDTNLFIDGTIATHFNWGDPEFTAHIAPSPSDGFEEMQIYIAGGVMRSLDDFFFRAFCNKDLFSWSVADDVAWNSCPCYFASLLDGCLKPVLRYWNYQPDMPGFIEQALSGKVPFLGVVTNYYSGIPVGDSERIDAAALASTVGFYWVYAHEVAHYRRGHFHAMQDHPDWFGIADRSSRGVDHLRMVEGGERHSPIADDLLSRQIEWDADRVAAEAIVDIFFHPDQAGKLPSYCTDKARWLLRLLITGMAGAALLFDRVAQFRGTSAEHPSGLARVIGIIIAACRRFDRTVGDTPVAAGEIKAFAGIETQGDAILFASDVAMEVLQDLLVMTEILENENIEGIAGPGYQLPLGDEPGDVPYIHYMTLTTMFTPSLWPAFDHLRDAANVPSSRWSTAVFDEIKGYLEREVEHPLSVELNRYTGDLHRMHEDKLAAARRQ